MKSKSNLQVNPKAIIDELRESDLPAEVVLDRQRKLQIEAEMAEKEESIRKKLDKQGLFLLIFVINYSLYCFII